MTKLLDPLTKLKVDRFIDAAPQFFQMTMEQIETLMGSCGHWKHNRYDESFSSFRIRDAFIDRYGYSVPCVELMQALHGPGLPIIDPMCGSGYLADQCRRAGLRVAQSDDASWSFFVPLEKRTQNQTKNVWTRPTLTMDAATSVRKHRGHVVLLSWPYMSDDGARVLDAMHQGQIVCYIGEGDGGCTANDRFFDLLRSKFKQLMDIEIPQFYGIHDTAEIWRRNGRS